MRFGLRTDRCLGRQCVLRASQPSELRIGDYLGDRSEVAQLKPQKLGPGAEVGGGSDHDVGGASGVEVAGGRGTWVAGGSGWVWACGRVLGGSGVGAGRGLGADVGLVGTEALGRGRSTRGRVFKRLLGLVEVP